MTDEQKDAIEERVLDDITELEERILDLEETTKPIAPDKGLGRLTRLDAMQDKSVKEAALRQARERFERLDVPKDLARCLLGIGRSHFFRHELDEAERALRQGIALHEQARED